MHVDDVVSKRRYDFLNNYTMSCTVNTKWSEKALRHYIDITNIIRVS